MNNLDVATKWREVLCRKGTNYNIGDDFMLKTRCRLGRVVTWELIPTRDPSNKITKESLPSSRMKWIRKIDNDDGKTYVACVYDIYEIDEEIQEADLIDYDFDWDAHEKWREQTRIEAEAHNARVNAVLAKYL
jgi:hypothetical protein